MNVGLDVSQHGGVLLVCLNRPEVLNAINTALGQALLDLFDGVNRGARPDARVIVMTGEGARAFCVGGDLKERNGMSDADWRAQRVIFKGYNSAMERCPVPILCAVNGFALGGGAEMVLRSDFAYASEQAEFGFPESRRGFMPGSGGTQRFARVAGQARAMEWIMTGERFSAQKALEWGLVNRILPQQDVLPALLETAQKIAANPDRAIRVIKQVIRAGAQADIETALHLETLGQQVLTGAADRQEGIAAFVEKRQPNWQD
ncbi:enoyl-CoA hydratase/isomerase family protein [Roseinatronobacter bogoriensis]|uniref:Enoyl-CoA hydratase/isomerase family protein n=1 Tax=Roseinatronobacter bogoriensis subsp. barguzinensis TaxID=441209 RepID=A0A2K8KDL0_9RHOB|nr:MULTISPECIES: enoyl-CoA hydratase/isomerase family protein [Rhodobaca]ATX67547.1 enoyl-CoA hydratase/isomerase family protein [Rhodobaca barguzinensis]MBB4209701.1 enoyl-CoA hydratase/carnithine racemase [Rhodobaca bogoriensis DSM 18756]TDW33876.1 enoyl-CoA hydratase/carnithine racemase [Rhodobaca barguzinensis]TDY66274.1 enoyl-CoA hydratase/carnithine racemase [Rhodobaca bogoriensis DSM 18756]